MQLSQASAKTIEVVHDKTGIKSEFAQPSLDAHNT
jgi:hypothetical protein